MMYKSCFDQSFGSLGYINIGVARINSKMLI